MQINNIYYSSLFQATCSPTDSKKILPQRNALRHHDGIAKNFLLGLYLVSHQGFCI